MRLLAGGRSEYSGINPGSHPQGELLDLGRVTVRPVAMQDQRRCNKPPALEPEHREVFWHHQGALQLQEGQ